MAKLLVVVDMQNDFIDGALGSPEAREIVPGVCRKIAEWDGDIITTMDRHDESYAFTLEGASIPPHCMHPDHGWELNPDVSAALSSCNQVVSRICKPTFGSVLLANAVQSWNDYDYVEFVGVCTDICVISNALLIRAHVPEMSLAVDASCCAGSSPQAHFAALDVMKSCLIGILSDPREEVDSDVHIH